MTSYTNHTPHSKPSIFNYHIVNKTLNSKTHIWHTIVWKEILTKEPVSILLRDLIGIEINCASFIRYVFTRNLMRYFINRNIFTLNCWINFNLFAIYVYTEFIPCHFGLVFHSFFWFFVHKKIFFNCFLFAQNDILSVLKWLPSHKKWYFYSRISFFSRFDLVLFSSHFFQRFGQIFQSNCNLVLR